MAALTARVVGGDHVDWKLEEFLRQLERAAELRVCVAPLDRNIAAFDIAQVVQSRPERFGKRMRLRQRHEHTDARNFSELLRARRERPGSRAADKRDELAPFQVIELHSVLASQGRIVGYRTGEDQSGGNNGTLLQPVSRWRGATCVKRSFGHVGSMCALPSPCGLKADISRGPRSARLGHRPDYLITALALFTPGG
jgi:hypothetical protein